MENIKKKSIRKNNLCDNLDKLFYSYEIKIRHYFLELIRRCLL